MKFFKRIKFKEEKNDLLNSDDKESEEILEDSEENSKHENKNTESNNTLEKVKILIIIRLLEIRSNQQEFIKKPKFL